MEDGRWERRVSGSLFVYYLHLSTSANSHLRTPISELPSLMELITILLSGITALFSLTGVVVDKNVEAAFRSQLDRAEQLQVRVDNAPVHQIINGKINKLRVAGRGLWVSKNLRIDTLDIETDPIAVDIRAIQADGQSPRASSLQQPIQAAVKLKFNEEDLNNFLKSPEAIAQLQQMTTSTFGAAAGSLNKDYQIANPQVKFLANNRLAISAELQDPGSSEKLPVTLETGLTVSGGRKFQLVEPTARVGETPIPPFLLAGLTTGISDRFNVDILEERGLSARILQLKVTPQQLELAAFVRISGRK
jgi:LmeA-like phospholipid-binding